VELGRDNVIISVGSMRGASGDRTVGSMNGCTDGNDDWAPVIESCGGDGPMKCGGLISCGKDVVGTCCVAMSIAYIR